MLSPDAIQKKEFEQSVIGGYRRDEVDDFLDELEADYKKLYTENIELVEKLKSCLATIEDYKKDENFLKTAIINAQKLNETTLREIELKEKEMEISAKEKATAIISEAEEKAAELLKKAEKESADAVRVAQEKCRAEIDAEQKKADAEIRRIHQETAAEQGKLDYLRTQVAEFKNTIIELYKGHLTSISKLPDFKVEEPVAEPVAEEVVEEAVAPVAENAPAAPVAEEVVEETAPVVEEKAEQKVESGKTVEFKLEEKEEKAPAVKPIEARQLKFENLKFGIDYDVNQDK